ncbi:uncharacterized protein LOC134508611 [Chroicocephalus ridibundus]|uniref:uncharacterized protein LOC134508611 n=1 Tax=Chroicocephalus ridibundus TaxID=1192867 RepID=UPI002FDE9F64
MILLTLFCICAAWTHANPLPGYHPHLFDPCQNVWVTLARSLNTTSFCASLATPSSPFTTCLVGVPLNNSTFLLFNNSMTTLRKQYNISGRLPFSWKNLKDLFEKYNNWDDKLPIGPEPQEIDLVDSLNASHCLFIGLRSWSGARKEGHLVKDSPPTVISPIGNATLWQQQWCLRIARDATHSAPGTMLPRRLPLGFFFICGNRAWSGIPSNPRGGPCTIGQLSLGTPHYHPSPKQRLHFTRDTIQALENTCDDNVKLWNRWEVFFASLFTPGVAAARAHRNLDAIACWVVKQANATSRILSEMAEDLSTVQHAVLQNRAAIDFLLLAHGHGCEDFDGMCCMDLEDHSSSMHKQITQLLAHSQKVQSDTDFFGLGTLGDWFGLKGWLRSLVQSAVLILVIILVGLLILSCALSCVRSMVTKVVRHTWFIQNGDIPKIYASVSSVQLTEYDDL